MPRNDSVRITDGQREVVIPGTAIEWQFARSGGPGGQHVNRTSTKAMLRFDLARSPHLPDDVRRRMVARVGSRLAADGTLVITSQVHRDQARNVADCIDRLSDLVRRSLAPPKRRRETRTPRSAIADRLDSKKRRAQTKRLRRRPEA
jgi:ribosome-associated protein